MIKRKKSSVLLVSLMLFTLVFGLFPTVTEASVYNGKKPAGNIINVKFQNGIALNYQNAWTNAYVNWTTVQSKKTIRYQANATNTLAAQFDANNPNIYGRIIYNSNSSQNSTPFFAYLNTYMSSIVSSANVRISTASHELGHALGLRDLTNYTNSIMYTSRNRFTLYYPTFYDIANVNNLY